MRSVFTIVLAVSFLGITLFGVLAANHDNSQAFMGCLASLVKGAMCPDQTDLFSFANFHLDVFKVFSLAFLIILLLAGGILVSFPKSEVSRSARFQIKRLETFVSRAHYAFLSWFSLHENSPSIL
ncbi:MAG: hypothetical protein A3A27_00165 [Candidatus Wildermuthbacteria bacterium RIFCSPLOWO2_01_FULL_47_18]|uniref:Uncharacterized protein n=2 Tax=Candidatus Wildermuthiibacteriota TaxID=1817923 RepID=A0A1G2RJR0_9BACT|nr:MAG: hypothetical protein A3J68_01235 [Candidatus Wildermuthbacteria bacterium RIFCSPHIGHO2_02_FULL_48_16]OHA72758.1 MAG: hypothetical protein A3A27_00165 [Candidatus Wildermuthbacteria bacterium RIFCSPLOWO2_01_FULL_47_18]